MFRFYSLDSVKNSGSENSSPIDESEKKDLGRLHGEGNDDDDTSNLLLRLPVHVIDVKVVKQGGLRGDSLP